MIIFGTRGVKSTIKEGQFDCPQCRQHTSYKHKKVTQFFTLYFIPIIPLGNKGEYVECCNCKATFVTHVLDQQTSHEEVIAEYKKAMLNVMCKMVLADHVIEEAEKEMLQKAMKSLADVELSMDEIDRKLEEVQKNNTSVHEYVKNVNHLLNDKGKEQIIRGALYIADSDGNIADEEIQLVNELGRAFELSSKQLKALIDETIAVH